MCETAEKRELFERTPIPKAILELALPAMAGQIILVIYNMADSFFLGLTGSDAMITAVTVCMPAFLFLSAIANLFGVGGASVISRSLGNKLPERAGGACAFALTGCMIVTLLYSAAVWRGMDRFLDLLGGYESSVHRLARSYLFCTVVLGGIVTSMNVLLAHLIRAEGHSVHASIGIALGGVLNIFLDPLFMFVLLPPGREALGAAIATTLSNAAALGYFAVLLLKNRAKTVLTFRPNRAMLQNGIPHDVIATGLPACVMTLLENISYAVLDNLASLEGIAVQAGLGIAKKVNMLAHCTVRGIAQGVLPLIGYNYAAGDWKRVRSAVTLSTLLSVGIAAACMGVCLLFSPQLIGIFIRHASPSLQYGADFLRILCVGAPFSACAYACISFFQATGCGMRAFLLAVFRKGLLDIPMMFLLRRLFAVNGVVWATPFTDIICCALALALFKNFLHKHRDALQPSSAPMRILRTADPLRSFRA